MPNLACVLHNESESLSVMANMGASSLGSGPLNQWHIFPHPRIGGKDEIHGLKQQICQHSVHFFLNEEFQKLQSKVNLLEENMDWLSPI